VAPRQLCHAATGRRTDRVFPRQALHAETLGFRHPVTGQPLSFSAPPPPDMAALLTLLDEV
jgi:23S rRNA pseudouridine1911/1915/1917 synthase